MAEEQAAGRWRVAWASMIGLTVSATSVGFYTQSLFLGPMTQEFGWARTRFFSALLVGGVAGALATPIVGRLLDRFGVRAVLIPGIVLFALANAAAGLIGPNLGAFLSITAVSAVAGTVQGPLSYSKAITGWFDRRRGLALAVALSGTGLGGVLVPPIAAYLIAEHGWRVAKFGMGAIVLIVALPAVLAFVREPARARTGTAPAPAAAAPLEGMTLRAALADPTLWLLIVAFLVSSVVVNGVLANLVPLLVSRGSLPALAAAALSLMAVGHIGGRFLSGLLLDRVQSARVGIVWYGLAFAGLLMIALVEAPPLVLLACLMVGAALGAELEMAAIFTSRFFGRRHFGAINGTIFAAYLVGAAGGPLTAGLLVTPAGGYERVLTAGLIAMAVASALLLATGRYRYLPAAASRDQSRR